MDNRLWYRRLYRQCIRGASSRSVKLLLLADLKRVMASLKAGPASDAAMRANGWML